MQGLRKTAAILAAVFLALGLGTSAARAAEGAEIFANNCAVCHSTDPGTNKLGPSLAGVVGRKSASEQGFAYSPAMTKENVSWDKATLDKYLADPQGMVPGTKMIFPGVKDEADRKALIDYLATLSG
jgi:cytochrome c